MNQNSAMGGIIRGELPNQALNYFKSKLKSNYVILNVSNVKIQIVSGIMYYFEVEILNNMNCRINRYDVIIWEQAWLNPPYKLQKITLKF